MPTPVGAGRHCNLGNKARGKEINLRRAEAARHVAAVGILVNLPRRAELQKLAILDYANSGSHGHGLDLIVGDIKYSCAQFDLDAFELQP